MSFSHHDIDGRKSAIYFQLIPPCRIFSSILSEIIIDDYVIPFAAQDRDLAG